jgi:hypothetical protein
MSHLKGWGPGPRSGPGRGEREKNRDLTPIYAM